MGLIIDSVSSDGFNLNFMTTGIAGDQLGHFRSGHRDSGGAGETPAATTTHRLASELLA